MCNHRHHHRRALATLELVLVLPILLLLMALMINFGAVACWKVRGLSAARNILWNTRWPRSGETNPRPDYWPAAAGLGAAGAGNAPAIDDTRVDLPVSRGPLPLAGATVNDDLLDPTRGLRQGTASLTRQYAMVAKMGSFHLDAASVLLDDRWQHGQMAWSYGGDTITVPGNTSWRIPVIYAIQTAAARYAGSYVDAVVAIYYASFRDALAPLDRDDEFIKYRGSAPDFYPRLNRFCSLDHELADARVNDLIDRIQGRDDPRVPEVAERMTEAFIALYESVIRQYRNQINATPPPSQTEIAAMRAEIKQLEKKIDILEQYLKTLQQ